MQNTKYSIAWSAFERFSVQGIQFTVSIILARLLSPSDFGLIALIIILLNILQTINEVGFGAALMFKQDRDHLDFSSIFVMNIYFGCLLYCILYFLAPLLASFFEQPQLTYLTRISGFNLIINSFIVVHRTKLMIDVDFKTQAKASFVAVIISGCIGIIAAYKGFGVMALIYQTLLGSIINVIFIWNFTKWHPTLKFSFSRFKNLFKFAYKLILARLINVIFEQFYSAVIGKMFRPAQLGYYNRAQSLIAISSNNLTTIVQRVSIPLLCKYQNDKSKMGQVLIKFIVSTAFFVFPLLFGIFVLARPLVICMLTEKWMPVALMLQILCPVGLLYVISTFNRNIFNATGRTDLALKTEIYKKVIFILIILSSIQFGFLVLLISQVLISIIEFLIDTYYTKKQIGIKISQQLYALKDVIFASLSMALLVFITTYFVNSDAMKLIIGLLLGILTYSILSYIFNIADFKNQFHKIKIFR